MNVLLVSVPAENELELGSGHELANYVKNVVTDDALGSGKISDAHLDDPALDVRDFTPLPLLNISLHLDVLGLPVIALHVFVEIVGPLVFQGEHVEKHCIASVNDGFGSDGGISFVFIENKSPISKVNGGR